jgi:hypothetical protein
MKCEGFSAPCGKYKSTRFRMRTFYVNEEDNYRILCPKCQEEAREYWNEMWQEYYSNVL